MTERTKSVLNGNLEMKIKDDTILLSVRIPKELFDWVDSYSRIAAVNQETRITRTMTVVNFLEMAKTIIEHREKTEWGNTHQDEIKKVLEAGIKRQADNDQKG